jgi:alanyl-tRNA synthetase
VVDNLGDVYPELRSRQAHMLETTRAEEERFLATIEGGMRRFDELAPPGGRAGRHQVISGDDAFRLYDTFGFPIDLTDLMARERGYQVDLAGFEAALAAQRTLSQEERKGRKLGVDADAAKSWEWETPGGRQVVTEAALPSFVGYTVVEIETQVTAIRHLDDGRVAVLLRETPFYAESGGQISDHGDIAGDGWRVDVNDVRKFDGRVAAIGTATGTVRFGSCVARVPTDRRRDTERNHTATHLLHAALREVLGDHVHQAGSLVAPDRLRFDFTHHGPVKPDALADIEARVNRGIWAGVEVRTEEKAYADAIASGAMALFGEKYGDVVRVVSIPGLSVELCGGTHVSNTSQIGLFRIASETGVAAGVRRIEALTGPSAFQQLRSREQVLDDIADLLKATPDTAVRKVQLLLDERRTLEKKLDEARRGGGDQVKVWMNRASSVGGITVVAETVQVEDARELQAIGDALREQLGSGVAALGASLGEGKGTLLVVATDDARDRGARADVLVRETAAVIGGRGGGKPHMAQAGVPDSARLGEAIAAFPDIVKRVLGA